MKKVVVPVISTIVLSAILIMAFWNVQVTPLVASAQGQSVDEVFRVLFILSAIVFSLVISFLGYSVVVFRRRPGDTEDARPVHGSTPLEIAWTVIPLIIVLALGVYGAREVVRINQVSAQPELVVDVVGVQWSWSFKYPEQGITSANLVLPVNQPVLFRLQSVDVIHSFWVPEFRIKMDAIPGTINELRITPTQPGDYRALCSELCGTAHAYMTAPVMVIEPADFDAWVAEQQELAGSAGAQAQRGQELSSQLGCLGCHTLDGRASVGPTFQGLFESERTLSDGTTAIADEAYLSEAILEPAATLVEGYGALMPQNFGERTTEEDVVALIEFIKSVQ